MQINNFDNVVASALVQDQIDILQDEYTALLNSIADKNWEQCRRKLEQCRSAYEGLFSLPAESLRQYAGEIQQLRLVNKQTLEFLDSLRQTRSKQLAKLRQAKKIQQSYALNQAS